MPHLSRITPVLKQSIGDRSGKIKGGRRPPKSGPQWSDGVLGAFMASTFDGMALLRAVGDADGRISDFRWVLINEEGGRLMTRCSADLIGRRLTATLPDLVPGGLLDRLAAVAGSGKCARFEAPSCGTGGGWFEYSAVPAEGGIALSFRPARSCRGRVPSEDAVHAERAKATFLSLMSHEIRTPLNGVVCALDLLAEGIAREDRDAFMETARKSGRDLARVIDEILDFAKLEGEPVELMDCPFRLSDLVAIEVDAVIRAAEAKGLTIACRIDAALSRTVRGDRQKLARILRNLLSNAIKFTEAGGLTVALESTDASADDLAAGRSGDLVPFVLSVTDSGIGIDPGYRASLFEAFSQADWSIKRRYGGCGLGLAVASRLAAAMGGCLTVLSEPGHGSSFRLHLTMRAADGPKPSPGCTSNTVRPHMPARQAAAPGPVGGGSRPRVLLADASEASRMVTGLMLMRAGFLVHTVTTGRSAVETARRTRFEAVLLDITMPDMGGLSMVSAIRAPGEVNEGVPMIGMTAHADSAEAARWRAAGLGSLLVKPFQKRDLLGMLEIRIGASALAAE
ncbi:ATP-binding protein [Skermanella pratensis]|uniref:ATP-binding protein n=1 Tax=Skermanella pratensis TaxID=2233999 RepID=UPI00178855C4|nr:ATP-binding protein [Skermanella pratensis]